MININGTDEKRVRMSRGGHDGAQMGDSECRGIVLNDYLWSEGDEQETFNNSANEQTPPQPRERQAPNAVTTKAPDQPIDVVLPRIMQNKKNT